MVRNDRSVVRGRHAHTRLLAHGMAGMHPTVEPMPRLHPVRTSRTKQLQAQSVPCRTELKPQLRHWSHIGDMHQTDRAQNTKMIDFFNFNAEFSPVQLARLPWVLKIMIWWVCVLSGKTTFPATGQQTGPSQPATICPLHGQPTQGVPGSGLETPQSNQHSFLWSCCRRSAYPWQSVPAHHSSRLFGRNF
jgi:hypothetical protein